jgi:integrase
MSQIDSYIQYLSRRKSPNTKRVYSSIAAKFAGYLSSVGRSVDENSQLPNARPLDIENFLSTFHVSGRSLALYSAAVASYLRFMGNDRLSLETPTNRYEVVEPEWLSRRDVFRIIDSCTDNMRKALCWLGFELALRIGEAIALKWSDIELQTAIVYIVREKKKRIERRAKPISRELCALLSEMEGRKQSDFVFEIHGGKGGRDYHQLAKNTAMVMMKGIFRNAGEEFEHLTFHVFRHSRAVDVAERTGGNIVEIAKVTDHDDPKNVFIYTHIAMTRLRSVMVPTTR